MNKDLPGFENLLVWQCGYINFLELPKQTSVIFLRAGLFWMAVVCQNKILAWIWALVGPLIENRWLLAKLLSRGNPIRQLTKIKYTNEQLATKVWLTQKQCDPNEAIGILLFGSYLINLKSRPINLLDIIPIKSRVEIWLELSKWEFQVNQ